MKSSTRQLQLGKSLLSFIMGLIIAIIIIVGVLLFLNKNKTHFKQPDVVQEQAPAQPEILTPNASSPIAASDDMAMSASNGMAIDASTITTQNNQISPTTTRTKPDRIIRKKAKPNSEKKVPQANKKVSPEDILNSGSIEKAQKLAKQSSNPAAQQKKYMVQIGSYADKNSADVQRAKLTMLGLDVNIHKVTNKNKVFYRVESETMTQQQAKQLVRQLKHNQIDSLIHTAP